MGQVFALLVGINAYTAPVSALKGCLNDVAQFESWLRENVAGRGLAIETLLDADATRANVIRGFRRFLSRAGAGDTVVFQYAGHGARDTSAPEFRSVDATGRDEGLVLFDTMSSGGLLLADKELAVLIGEVAQRGANVSFILDSCHSGSGTRQLEALAGMQARATEMAPRGGGPAGHRPLDTYLDGYFTERLARKQPLQPPPGRHVLLAACRRGQTAREFTRETPQGSTRHGLFTTTLMEALEQTGGRLSYVELFRRCHARVRARQAEQDPQFEPIAGFDPWSGFLGGAVRQPSLRHSVAFDRELGRWKVDVGALHGFEASRARPLAVTLFDEADPSRTVGSGRVTRLGAQRSVLALDDGFKPDPQRRFRAGITSMPCAPMVLHCAAGAAQRRAWQEALDGDDAAAGACGALLADQPAGTAFALELDAGALTLTRRDTGATLFGPVPAADAHAVAEALRRPIQHVARWQRMLALRNPETLLDTRRIELQCLEIQPGRDDFAHSGPVATLSCDAAATAEARPRPVLALLRARNLGDDPLNYVLVQFTGQFGIEAEHKGQLPPNGQWVTVWGARGRSGFLLARDAEGVRKLEASDRFKLVVSRDDIDDFMLTQGPLDAASDAASDPATPAVATTRDAVVFDTDPEDWATVDLHVRVLPRADTVGDRDWSDPAGHCTVRAHPRLRASVRLVGAGTAARGAVDGSADDAAIAVLARAGLVPLDLGSGRNGDAGALALELGDIQDLAGLRAALAEEPLRIDLHQPLADDAALLAVAFDGEHLLPCGQAVAGADGHACVTIDTLPEQTADQRSLGGAIKLLFFKAARGGANVNRLRWVEYGADGRWAHRREGIAERVAAAQRVLLMVHGITGDTEGMAAAAPALGLTEAFDLVLTYDYENLNTPIERAAALLAEDLAAVGLHAGDGRHLTLLVHSMGGLVSRWFIERLGGHAVVDRLVMCGTPNHGSPLGHVSHGFSLLRLLAGVSLNSPTPASMLLRFLLTRADRAAVTLQQMQPGSDFMRELNASADPGIPYTILAGDVGGYDAPEDPLFARLVGKLGRSGLLEAIFQRAAHDICVSLESIRTVGAHRTRDLTAHEVGCHHMNYFTSAAGQAALRAVDWGRPRAAD